MSYPKEIDLEEVNSEVNLIPYEADKSKYYSEDYWARIPATGGDCEDYALGKLERLYHLGWPIDKLRLALCTVETREYHCVLAVDISDEKQVILDNRFSVPVSLDELERIGYKPDKIQKIGGSQTFVQWIWG